MKQIKFPLALFAIAACAFAVSTFTGCATSGGGVNLQSAVTPANLQLIAENGTCLALEKYPQIKQPLEAVVTGITNATAGGALNISATTLTASLNQLGFGGLANQPGAALIMDDLSAATAQFDAQQGTNGLTSNTNLVPALNAIAAGMERGIQIYNQ